jgi:hypothetical protein
MNSPAVPERGNMRASDADRERVAEVLRQAAGDGRLTLEELDERLDAVYAAKTYTELEPVTQDLPDPGAANAPSPVPAAAPAGDPARFGGQPGSSTAIAIMGGFTRKGDWVVPKDFTAFALMGGGEIDMREARFEQQSVTLHVVAIMGGFEITVPEDANVHVTGIGIMGGFDHGASGGGDPGGPIITINGLALMGGVEVKRKRSKRPERLDRTATRLDRKIERLERRSRELE